MQILSHLRFAIVALLMLGLVAPMVHADAALRDMRGQITTLAAQQTPGQWTVVMIWASDCHVCNEEVGEYVKFHNRHAGGSAQVVGMSIDGWSGRKDVDAFIARHEVNFPNVIGDVDTVARWYAAETGEAFRATPTFVVFGPAGEIRAAQAGAVPPDVIEEFIRTRG